MSKAKNTMTVKEQEERAFLHAETSASWIMTSIASSVSDTLVIGGYNAQLSVRTKYGVKCLSYQERGMQEPVFYRPGKHGLKRIIWLWVMTRPSQQVLYWIQENGIQLVLIEKNGRDVTLTESNNDITLLSKQNDLMKDQLQQLEASIKIMKRKVTGQADVLRKYAHMLVGTGDKGRQYGTSIEEHAHEIESLGGWFDCTGTRYTQTKRGILAIEGKCAESYFECWHGMEVPWVQEDLDRNAVDPSWQVFTYRADHHKRMDPDKTENCNAHDPVNALLNLGYHIVEKRLKRACLKAGLHPDFSFYHVNQLTSIEKQKRISKDALLHDFIEPLRPMVDAAILKLLSAVALHREWFVVDEWGVVHCAYMLSQALTFWLEKEILDSMIEEIIEEHIIWLKATQFAPSVAEKTTGNKTEQKRKPGRPRVEKPVVEKKKPGRPRKVAA